MAKHMAGKTSARILPKTERAAPQRLTRAARLPS